MKKNKKPCLLAYTYQGRQPVICTIVSDQPYFYEADTEADWMESGTSDFIEMSDEWLEVPQQKPVVFSLEPEDYLDLPELIFILEKSQLFVKVWSKGSKVISLSEQVQTAELKDDGTIVLYNRLSKAEAILQTIRLARIYQRKAPNVLELSPDSSILQARLNTADEVAFMFRIAWELKLQQIPEPLDCLGLSFPDIYRTAVRTASDFRTLRDGKFMIACLETWFLNYVYRTDKKTIQSMLADIDFHNRKDYNLTHEDIRNFGELPREPNYLVNFTNTLLTDPLFVEVRDRSNANFLWFIKFEKSFREEEQNKKKD